MTARPALYVSYRAGLALFDNRRTLYRTARYG